MGRGAWDYPASHHGPQPSNLLTLTHATIVGREAWDYSASHHGIDPTHDTHTPRAAIVGWEAWNYPASHHGITRPALDTRALTHTSHRSTPHHIASHADVHITTHDSTSQRIANRRTPCIITAREPHSCSIPLPNLESSSGIRDPSDNSAYIRLRELPNASVT